MNWTKPLNGTHWSVRIDRHPHCIATCTTHAISQHLSSVVERGDLHEEARALRTLAGIYKETQQMTKAEDYYRKV